MILNENTIQMISGDVKIIFVCMDRGKYFKCCEESFLIHIDHFLTKFNKRELDPRLRR